MSRGAILDIAGHEVSEEECAQGLGFHNVQAFREWHIAKNLSNQLGWALAEICNLKQKVAQLESHLVNTGTERIG